MSGRNPEKRCLNVVWRRRVLDDFLEAPFMRSVLLSRLRRPVRWIAIEDNAELPLIDDLLICSFGNPDGYLANLRAAGHRNIGVFHLGDEHGIDDIGFYAQADYVLRHYYFPERLVEPGGFNQKILWMPNGWARGVGPADTATHVPFAERTHSVFFAGYAGAAGPATNERAEMLESLRAYGIAATIILSQGFGQGLGAGSYAAYMGDAKLALAPGGNAPETIRLYDALEHGALPVIIDRPWLHAADGLAAVGTPPFIILTSWDDLPQLLPGVTAPAPTARRDDWQRQTDACRQWWQSFKDHTAGRVAAAIEAAFADAAGTP